MKNISINYLGLKLKSPVIISSSPFTSNIDKIVELEQAGAGAVVLKSIFEEQIMGESAVMESYSGYTEAQDYLKTYMTEGYLNDYIKLIKEAKQRTSIPVIASINCISGGEWTQYAKRIESAGADALELNIVVMPTTADQSASQIEEQYLSIVSDVCSVISIPVSVKLSIRFTNILSVAAAAYNRGAKGVVMYNRLFEPDIDIENLSLVQSDAVSSASELRNALRTIAICSSAVATIDIAVSSGVHSGADAVKAILAGAKGVEICSALYEEGFGVIGEINTFISQWMDRHSYDRVENFCGAMNYKGAKNAAYYERVQYMKYFPGK